MRRIPLVFAVLLPSYALAQVEGVDDGRSQLRVVATAGIAGRFAHARCDEAESLVPHETADFTAPLLARGGEDAFVVDTGGLLAPHGVTRFANRDFPAAVADLVSLASACAPAPRTLGVGRAAST